MTETTESLDQPSIVPDLRETVVDRRPSRLNQVAAWVGIVAGIVFIVGSVFFTGFILGHRGGHGGGWGVITAADRRKRDRVLVY